MFAEQKLTKSRIRKFICFMLILTSCLGLFVFIQFTIHPSIKTYQADKNEPDDTALAFMYSLPLNKIEDAKLFVAHDKWNFLDQWAAKHKPISNWCRYRLDPDFQGAMGGSWYDSDGSYRTTLIYNLVCPNIDYWFTGKGIELDLIAGKWTIVNWDEICETTKYGSTQCVGSDDLIWYDA